MAIPYPIDMTVFAFLGDFSREMTTVSLAVWFLMYIGGSTFHQRSCNAIDTQKNLSRTGPDISLKWLHDFACFLQKVNAAPIHPTASSCRDAYGRFCRHVCMKCLWHQLFNAISIFGQPATYYGLC